MDDDICFHRTKKPLSSIGYSEFFHSISIDSIDTIRCTMEHSRVYFHSIPLIMYVCFGAKPIVPVGIPTVFLHREKSA